MMAIAFVGSLVLTLLGAAVADALTLPTVPIGNPGNPAYARPIIPLGAVPYSFRIGKTEVTNSQYVEFLSAVATSDPYRLFDTSMSTSPWGGIVRSGSPGSYAYVVKPPAVGQGPEGGDYNYDNKPVLYVSWYDAIRFTNWLHNGQGNGDTESGAYTLGDLDGFGNPTNGSTITRNPGARWWLPSEDEWFKAAYYDPVAGTYYDFPTSSNDRPNNNLPSADTGNSANFYDGDLTTANYLYSLTDTAAYAHSESPYGTFDQGGNVREWNETFSLSLFPNNRGRRGGSYEMSFAHLSASAPIVDDGRPDGGGPGTGFRVATIIPEPSSALLSALACCGILLGLRRVSARAMYGCLLC
jgi:formylglycine-generating enzyme